MDPYEQKQSIKRTLEGLEEQRKRVASSKKEAKKLLKQLGIWHLLVPREKLRPSTGKK
jgi:hypothetical protein